MEDDVVFPDEVVVPGLRIVPEVPPSVRCTVAAVPLPRRGEVSHHGLEPDIDPLRFVPGDWHLDAPVEVPRDRPIFQPLSEPASHEREHVMPPMLLVLDRKSTRLNSSHDQISYAVF